MLFDSPDRLYLFDSTTVVLACWFDLLDFAARFLLFSPSGYFNSLDSHFGCSFLLWASDSAVSFSLFGFRCLISACWFWLLRLEGLVAFAAWNSALGATVQAGKCGGINLWVSFQCNLSMNLNYINFSQWNSGSVFADTNPTLESSGHATSLICHDGQPSWRRPKLSHIARKHLPLHDFLYIFCA